LGIWSLGLKSNGKTKEEKVISRIPGVCITGDKRTGQEKGKEREIRGENTLTKI
jgi:hypothetical protein